MSVIITQLRWTLIKAGMLPDLITMFWFLDAYIYVSVCTKVCVCACVRTRARTELFALASHPYPNDWCALLFPSPKTYTYTHTQTHHTFVVYLQFFLLQYSQLQTSNPDHDNIITRSQWPKYYQVSPLLPSEETDVHSSYRKWPNILIDVERYLTSYENSLNKVIEYRNCLSCYCVITSLCLFGCDTI